MSQILRIIKGTKRNSLFPVICNITVFFACNYSASLVHVLTRLRKFSQFKITNKEKNIIKFIFCENMPRSCLEAAWLRSFTNNRGLLLDSVPLDLVLP